MHAARIGAVVDVVGQQTAAAAEVVAAWQVARDHAARAGVEVLDLAHHGGMGEVSRLFDEVWGRDPSTGSVLSPEALTALAHAGAQVSCARRGGQLVGATAAFLGRDEHGETFLHSHVTGVRPGLEGHGIGRALKWHQRAWCLHRGIGRVRWTFDPLQRRNAVLNLVVLAARAVRYEEDVYGSMRDQLNVGQPTDRLLVEWALAHPRVEAASRGRTAVPDIEALRRAGAQVALDEAPDGAPVEVPTEATLRLVRIPGDIAALRAAHPELAGAWGEAVRRSLGGALASGLRVTGISRDGWYVLSAERGVSELRGPS